jgi:hypothetical protein
VDLADAKRDGKLFKRLAASTRAALAFASLLTIPSIPNEVPRLTRLEPAY